MYAHRFWKYGIGLYYTRFQACFWYLAVAVKENNQSKGTDMAPLQA